jgi:hypothetical protein
MFDETLSSRVARLEEAHRAAVEARETAVDAFSAADAATAERLESALAEIERSLQASGF